MTERRFREDSVGSVPSSAGSESSRLPSGSTKFRGFYAQLADLIYASMVERAPQIVASAPQDREGALVAITAWLGEPRKIMVAGHQGVQMEVKKPKVDGVNSIADLAGFYLAELYPVEEAQPAHV